MKLTPTFLKAYLTEHPLMPYSQNHRPFTAFLGQVLLDHGEKPTFGIRYASGGGNLIGFYWKNDWWWAKGPASHDDLSRYMAKRNHFPVNDDGLPEMTWDKEDVLSEQRFMEHLRHFTPATELGMQMQDWRTGMEARLLHESLPVAENKDPLEAGTAKARL